MTSKTRSKSSDVKKLILLFFSISLATYWDNSDGVNLVFTIVIEKTIFYSVIYNWAQNDKACDAQSWNLMDNSNNLFYTLGSTYFDILLSLYERIINKNIECWLAINIMPRVEWDTWKRNMHVSPTSECGTYSMSHEIWESIMGNAPTLKI